MDLTPYFIMALLSVLIAGPLVRTSYDTPRRLLVSLVGVSALVWSYGEYGVRINLGHDITWLVFGLMGWWVFTTLMTSHSHSKMVETGTWLGIVMFVVFGFDGLSTKGIGIVVIGAVVNCLVALAQRYLKWEPIKSSLNGKIHAPIGLIGNTNMLGNFLVVNLFLSIWLAQTSLWWLAATGLMGVTIYVTKCRGSYVGVFVGWFVLYLLGDFSESVERGLIVGWFMTGAVVVIYNKRYIFGPDNDRLKYWRLAWEQIKKTPLIGVGLGGFFAKVPYLQRELNGKTNGRFLDPATYKVPWPESSHNDYIQMACDVGVVGLVGYIGLVWFALMAPVDPILKAGLVGVMTTGIFLHNLSIIPVNVWVWFLVFICLRSYGETTTLDIGLYGLVGVVVVIIGFLTYILKEFLGDYYFNKSKRKQDPSALDKCLSYIPDGGYGLAHKSALSASQNQPWDAIKTTIQGIEHYDGEMRMWHLWSNLGKGHLMLGDMLGAENCAREALSFYPHSKVANQLMDDLRKILTRGYQVKRTVEVGK